MKKVSQLRDTGRESQPVVLVLAMPMPENIANARMHWRVKQNAKKAYYSTLDTMQAAKLLPSPPVKPWANARIASDMLVWNYMDTDNAMARHKWPLDWLQSRGYIANDKHLQWAAMPAQTITRRGANGLVLTLTDTSTS